MWCHGSLDYGLFVCWQLCDEGTLVRIEPDCWWGDRNECHTRDEKGQVFCHVLQPRQNQATSCLTDEWTDRQIKMRMKNSEHPRWKYNPHLWYSCLYCFVVLVQHCNMQRAHTVSPLTVNSDCIIPLYYSFSHKTEQSKHNIWRISIVTIKPPGTKD